MLRSMIIVTSTALSLPAIVQGGVLALTAVTCGARTCDSYQYCSQFNHRCENCDNICTSSSRNFDEPLCKTDCKDYIHDLRHNESSMQHVNDLKADIIGLRAGMKDIQAHNNTILMLLILSLILFIIVHGLHFFRWVRRRVSCSPRIFKNKPKKPQLDIVQVNPHTQSPKTPRRPQQQTLANGRASTVLSGSVMGESTVGTVSTHLRHPAEDSTLDHSYDNGGLSVTPVSEKPKGTETNF